MSQTSVCSRSDPGTSDCTCGNCQVGSRGQELAVLSCEQTLDCSGRTSQMVSPGSQVPWLAVASYQFPPLLSRLELKLGWSQGKAAELFADTKRFLYLCATLPGGPYAPPAEIDECWHHFILFTEEYASFCQRFFGRFLHHRPRYPTDPPGNGPIRPRTWVAAKQIFGQLSDNWAELSGTCCSGSTNCQDV